MTTYAPAKKGAAAFNLLLFSALILISSGCLKKRPEMATELFKKTHNKIFKEASPDSFAVVLNRVFHQRHDQIKNGDLIIDFYRKNHYTPVFTLTHVYNGDLGLAANYFSHADDHGLKAEMFQASELNQELSKFDAKPGFKTLDEAYEAMAEVELTAANSLINYSNALQFGVINPKGIYQRYFLNTARPDSNFMLKVFHIGDMRAYLDGLQPKDPQYLALQKSLKAGLLGPKMSAEETKRLIIVNLERLRWRNKPVEDHYVMVNVPDFTLDVIDSEKSVLHMKVCVGQGRNMDYANTLEHYNDTCKEDNPGDHETPLLNSMIYGVEVNPIWNIPRSIAKKEIIIEAAKDKFYLDNNNIDVYKNDKLVDDPESIDWTKVTPQNMDYDFKQRPGSDNSLGLIKFMFDNKSNVYLHDTPAKWAFGLRMRAVSHGCVRLGDPKGLALSLFGEGPKFKLINDDMGKDDPDPTTIYLPKKTPVYIVYKTCWADEGGNLQFRRDVYGLDIVLWDHLERLMHVRG